MIDKAIIYVVCMTGIISLFIVTTGMGLTFVQKTGFNRTCRSTLQKMDMDGGLTDNTRLELLENLEKAGFVQITIQSSNFIQYGEWIPLKVNASIKKKWWNGIFQMKEEMLYFSYDKKIVSRTIHNMAY